MNILLLFLTSFINVVSCYFFRTFSFFTRNWQKTVHDEDQWLFTYRAIEDLIFSPFHWVYTTIVSRKRNLWRTFLVLDGLYRCQKHSYRLLGSGSSPVSWCDYHEQDSTRARPAEKIHRVCDNPIMTLDEDQSIFLATSVIFSSL